MLARHPILSVFTGAYLVLVGWLTLGPQPLADGGNSLLFRALDFFDRHDATRWITYDRLEFGANIAMFFPIGLFFLLLLGRRYWWLAMLAAVALTAGIEAVQTVIPSRVSDVRDIVSNTIGAVLGVLVGLVLTAPKERRLKREAAQRAAVERAR